MADIRYRCGPPKIKALDSTASQWSFQLAYQETSWKDDLVSGQPRAPGLDNYAQVRVVAPLES